MDISADRLEISLRTELKDPRISRGVDSSGSGVICVGTGAGGAVKNPVIYTGELGMVPGIEALRLELYTGPFGEVEILEQRQVPVVSSRALHNALGRIAKH